MSVSHKPAAFRRALLVAFLAPLIAPALATAAFPNKGHASQTLTRAARKPVAQILWMEPNSATPTQRDQLPHYRIIPASDPRLKNFEHWADTEAARFARSLVYAAFDRFNLDHTFKAAVLPILIRKDGNNAARGFALETPAGLQEHPVLPYLILDATPESLGDTLLHETGHFLHTLATAGKRDGAWWSAFPHTTFAVSDPVTALAEGYAIHFETMWGHFGNDPAKMAYYHRLAPSFEQDKGRKGEYMAPLDDLMNFAQVWARYQSVRDNMAAFEGHVYKSNYARGQMDPARDRAVLKTPNAMLASEGVAASTIFWTSTALAERRGARPGAGLDQGGIIEAEILILRAISKMPDSDADTFKPDLLDLVEGLTRLDTVVGDIAIARFVDITKGVTARPEIRTTWHTLYNSALLLDLTQAKALIASMDAGRNEIVQSAKRDFSTLRAGLGPVVPVSLPSATFTLAAFDRTEEVDFDLNAMSTAEFELMPGLTAEARTRIEQERARQPFRSLDDFSKRTGLDPQMLGLMAIRR